MIVRRQFAGRSNKPKNMKNIKSIVILITLLICLSCSNKTKLKSNIINDKTERIRILNKEVKIFSEIQNGEFDLFNENGFGDDFLSVPGASYSYYLFSVKIKPNDIEKWKEGLIEKEGEIKKEKWVFDLIKVRRNEWIFNSEPKFYTRKEETGVDIIIFEKEGIIFKRIIKE